MNVKTILLAGSILVMGVALNSCQKKGCTDPEATNYDEKAKKDDNSCIKEDAPETQSTDDHNTMQREYDDILSTVEDVMKDYNDEMDKSGSQFQPSVSDTSCATVTLDTTYSTNGAKGRITIDFGTTNCIGLDGRSRRGKIHVDYTGRYRTVGTVITTTFEDFHVNDNKIEGTKTVTTQSREVYNVSVTGAKITFTDASTITWESERTRTWVGGNDTTLADMLNIWNDVYEISGTASGTGRFGRTFTVSIDQVTIKLQCWLSAIFHPVSGTITVSPQDLDDRVVDYGDGTCDKKGTITIGSDDPIEYNLDK